MSTSINTCLAPTPMPQAAPASPGFGAVLEYKPKSPTQLRPYIKEDSPDAGTLRNLLNSAGVKTDGRSLSDAVTEFQTNYNKGTSTPIGVDGKAGSETLAALQKQIRGIDQSDRMFGGGAVTRDPAQKAFLDRPIDYSAMNKPAAEGSVSGAALGSASAGGGDAAVRAALDKKLAATGGRDVHQVTDGIGNKKDVQILSPDSPGSRNPKFATTPELSAALDAKGTSVGGAAKPSTAQLNDFLAALQKRDDTNHPHNPGYHSSREAVKKFEAEFPSVAEKAKRYFELDNTFAKNRTEMSQFNSLRVELGLAPPPATRGGIAGH